MTLSWNEIRSRAQQFAKEHADDSYERGETQKFWIDFFEIFGVNRRRLDFERRVKIGDSQLYVDCFLPKEVLIEHKSKGRDLEKAFEQARNYLVGLKDAELPNYILVSDFEIFRLYDLTKGSDFYEFSLHELSEKIELFAFLTGRKKVELVEEDPVNLTASKLMGDLHDTLFDAGFQGHDLEVFLVRVLFCMFAEDTGIFDERKQFENFVRNRTHEDGSDLGSKIQSLFQALDTNEDKRMTTLDEELNAFPYVNGKLFAEVIRTPSFNSQMRAQILDCAEFDWSKISPAIFGSLFQYVMDPEKRRMMGAHYTDEQNILKVIQALFLDDLRAEFAKIKGMKRERNKKLQAFHEKLGNLDFFDPACGCGNFLVVTYRELRKLELEVLKILLAKQLKQRQLFDIREFVKLDVNQFYGIELEEFSAKIAEVSMWLMDHQANQEVAVEFGQSFARIPLRQSATIVHGNALRIDWREVVSPEQCDYILGNPPFYGANLQTDEQKNDMQEVFGATVKKWKSLDYVSAWYKKATEFIQDTNIQVGFVSTNSITQGEQVGILWLDLMQNHGVKINFAHQTFKWNNQASGKAQVFVVIIGFALLNRTKKFLYEYDDVRGEPHKREVKNINAYLVEGSDLIIENKTRTLCSVPGMQKGSQPTDDGNFLFTEKEKEEFLIHEPTSEKLFKDFISAKEFLNGGNRYCLWLKDVLPGDIRNMPSVIQRIENVKEFRLKSTKKATRENAQFASLFTEIRQPSSNYILVPRHSAESRKYIPMGFFTEKSIVADSCTSVTDATLYHFGVMTSEIHMAWTRYVCGRLKGDYRYSNQIVYNNFPWPEKVSGAQKKKIEELAQGVLDEREKFPDSSLADLYDPLTMPPALLKAHQTLDKAVEAAYTKRKFKNDAERVAFLFERWEKLVKDCK